MITPTPDPDLTPPERPTAKAQRSEEKKMDTLGYLKTAIGVVLLGGSSAWAGGQYAANNVAHEIKLYAQRADVLEQRVMQAQQSATRAEAMLELLLKKEGIAVPVKDASVSSAIVGAIDGGTPDAGL